MARSRFDKLQPSSPEKAELLVLEQQAGHTNTKTLQYINPHLDAQQAINSMVLPQQTIYLIDKVVRAKALQGPIGVDNSEVINLEMERELKRRTKNLANHN